MYGMYVCMYVRTTMVVLTNNKQTIPSFVDLIYHGAHRFDLVRVLGTKFWTLNEKKHNCIWCKLKEKTRVLVLGQLWWEIGTDPRQLWRRRLFRFITEVVQIKEPFLCYIYIYPEVPILRWSRYCLSLSIYISVVLKFLKKEFKEPPL
jgi:hypothetical protein